MWYISQYGSAVLIGTILIVFLLRIWWLAQKVQDKEYSKSKEFQLAVLLTLIFGVVSALTIGLIPAHVPKQELKHKLQIKERNIEAPTTAPVKTLEERVREAVKEAEESRKKAIEEFNKLPNAKDRG